MPWFAMNVSVGQCTAPVCGPPRNSAAVASGNSSEPHLHIEVLESPTLDFPDVDAVHAYPIVFRDVTVTRGGSEQTTDEADLRRGDQFSPTSP
jgi:hypothetical protein